MKYGKTIKLQYNHQFINLKAGILYEVIKILKKRATLFRDLQKSNI